MKLPISMIVKFFSRTFRTEVFPQNEKKWITVTVEDNLWDKPNRLSDVRQDTDKPIYIKRGCRRGIEMAMLKRV